jgi:hypothetical protein
MYFAGGGGGAGNTNGGAGGNGGSSTTLTGGAGGAGGARAGTGTGKMLLQHLKPIAWEFLRKTLNVKVKRAYCELCIVA